MQEIKLPMLRPISKVKKPKILLLSDDLTFPSGIGTMSREFVSNLAHKYDWVQLGASTDHPDHGKIKDISQAIAKEKNIPDANVKIYCNKGYGNPEILREIIYRENPDAILHFTDPRFWEWLYYMDYEIRSVYKKPILYYNIWDCPPSPFWNRKYYKSSDLLMNISQQTHALVKSVLGENEWSDVLTGEGQGPTKVGYVPHGIDPKLFYPIEKDNVEYDKFRKDIYERYPDAKFIIFWNNRNIARKQGGNLLLAYRRFCDKLKDKAKNVLLIMHTNPLDPNGTDLFACKDAMCPDYNVHFSTNIVPTQVINFYYNIANVTINIASNEGFGISGAESLMSGTMIINNVTGGLQDHCGFKDNEGNPLQLTGEFPSNHAGTYREHGKWVVPIYPSNRSIQGSLATPYIFDDRCDFVDVAKAIRKVYDMTPEDRAENASAGREFALQNFSTENMCSTMDKCISDTLATWKPKAKFELIEANKPKEKKQLGIIY